MATTGTRRAKPGRHFDGARIRQLRQEHKLSLREFGARIGYSGQTVANIESGSIPSVRLVDKVAQVFGVDVEFFWS